MSTNIQQSSIADLVRWMAPGKHLIRMVEEIPNPRSIPVKEFFQLVLETGTKQAFRELRDIVGQHPLPKGIPASPIIASHLKRRKPLRGRGVTSRTAMDLLVADQKVFDALTTIMRDAGISDADIVDVHHELRPREMPRGSKLPHYALKRATKALARSRDARILMASVIAHYQDDQWASATLSLGVVRTDWLSHLRLNPLFKIAVMVIHGSVAEWARAFAIELPNLETLVSWDVDIRMLRQATNMLAARLDAGMPLPMPIDEIISGTDLDYVDIERATLILRRRVHCRLDYITRSDDYDVDVINLHRTLRVFPKGPVVIDALAAVHGQLRGEHLDVPMAEIWVDRYPHLFRRVYKIPTSIRENLINGIA